MSTFSFEKTSIEQRADWKQPQRDDSLFDRELGPCLWNVCFIEISSFPIIFYFPRFELYLDTSTITCCREPCRLRSAIRRPWILCMNKFEFENIRKKQGKEINFINKQTSCGKIHNFCWGMRATMYCLDLSPTKFGPWKGCHSCMSKRILLSPMNYV